jgi:hypothetical protein
MVVSKWPRPNLMFLLDRSEPLGAPLDPAS